MQPSPISRRQFAARLMTLTGATAVTPHLLSGMDDGFVTRYRVAAAEARIAVQHLRGNVVVLIGAGGNIAVLPGRDGKLIVDAGLAGAKPQIESALASLSSDPITRLINTHWHFDHTDGNEWIHAAGATITAHENTRVHLSSATRVEGWDFTFPPSPVGALPTDTLEEGRSLDVNGTPLQLQHYWPAHTDSDISVYFANADIFHTGDTWWNGSYPFIDYSTGGNIDGMVRAAEENLAALTDSAVIIPGHGNVGSRAELAQYRDMLADMRDKIAAMKAQGMPLEAVIAARPGAVYDDKWGSFLVSPADFVGLVYQGV